MKKNFIALLSLISLTAFFACTGSGETTGTENDFSGEHVAVKFQPNISTGTVSSNVSNPLRNILANTQITNAASIVVTLSTTSNTAIEGLTQKQISLINFNGNYLSEPLLLSPGAYRIQEFTVLDADNNAIYVAPQSGSARAYLVTNPLYIDFTVSADAISMVTPIEVLSAADATPEDFGYASFDFTVIGTFKFCINTMIYNTTTSAPEFTTSNITVVSGGKTLYSGTLAAIANNAIEVPESTSDYIITLKKTLYDDKVLTMTMQELQAAFATPINAILDLSPVVISQIKITGEAVGGGGAESYTINVTNVSNVNVREVGSVGLYFYADHTAGVNATMTDVISSGEYFVFAWAGGTAAGQRTFTFYNRTGGIVAIITLSATDLSQIVRNPDFAASGETFVRFYFNGTTVTTESITL